MLFILVACTLGAVSHPSIKQSEFCCDLLKWLEMPLSFSSELIKVPGYSTFVLLRNVLKENKPGVGGESGGGYKGATNPRIG